MIEIIIYLKDTIYGKARTIHVIYTGFDWLSDLDIEETFPEDDIPAGVHFETLDDDCNSNLDLTVDVFLCWLNEGRYNCDVAQDLLRLWTHTLSGSKHETLYDFFQNLLDEYKEETEDKSATSVSLSWLSKKSTLLLL